MEEIVSTLLEGLLHQKEQLELTIEELNQFEKAYGKDSKITQDRLDKLSVDLDKISQDIDTLKSIKHDTIDLSAYATLDDVKQALDSIVIPEIPKVINGIDGVSPELDYNEIESLVIQWLQSQDLKGKDGITPSDEYIKSIVYEWLNANKDSLKGAKGDSIKGLDGINGIGIDTITYKNNTLYITLTDGTKKEFKLPVQYVGGGGGEPKLLEIANATKEPTGFERSNPKSMGIIEGSPDGINILIINYDGTFSQNASGLFAQGTSYETPATVRTLVMYPTEELKQFWYWHNSNKIVFANMVKTSITNVDGQRVVYFNDKGELLEEFNNISSIFESYSAVCSIFRSLVSMTKVVFGDERHGIRMDGDTHAYLHLTQGTKYSSGASINGLTTSGTTYTNIASGVFFDEDIKHLPQTQINLPFWYRTTSWNVTPDGNLLGYKTTGNVFYNQFTTSWNLTPVAISKYCLIHVYFTNDAQYPYVKILGQVEYATKALAKTGAFTELQKLSLDGLPTLEFKALYSIIINHLGELQLTDEGELFVDWRKVDTR